MEAMRGLDEEVQHEQGPKKVRRLFTHVSLSQGHGEVDSEQKCSSECESMCISA